MRTIISIILIMLMASCNNGTNMNSSALYEVYLDPQMRSPLMVGETQEYVAQAVLGPSDATSNSTFNWLVIDTTTSTIVDTVEGSSESYVFEAVNTGVFQIRARGYLKSDESKNSWEKFMVTVEVVN